MLIKRKSRKSRKAPAVYNAAKDNTQKSRESRLFRLSLICRIFLFGILWWVLTGDVESLLGTGTLIILLSALISVQLLAPFSISVTGLLYFTWYFVGTSIRGAVDVALCALNPKRPIDPGLAEYRFHLPLDSARVFMANSVSLIPGTLSTNMNNDWLYVHVLNKSFTFEAELDKLERHVARLFNIRLLKN